MKNNLRKYWFVILVGVLLVAGVVYYAVDLSNTGEFDHLKGKTVNGQDVLYSFNDVDVTADDFYTELYADYGTSSIAQLFIREVTDQTVETTDEMTTEAEANADNVRAQFQQNYGDDADATLLQALQQYGYSSLDELDDLFINEAKSVSLMTDYVTVEKKDVYDAYVADKSPRIVSHILIQMADPDNPTEEESAKLEEVKQALADGMSFEEAAYTYSDDSSADSYGMLGFMDADTSFVPEFLETAINTESGATSDWFKTDYGYHIIKVNSTDIADFITESDFSTAFAQYDDTMNSSLYSEAIWAAAQKLNVEFTDPDMEQELATLMGIGGTE